MQLYFKNSFSLKLGILAVLISFPFSVGAFFSGEAEATGNSFEIGTLDFAVDDDTHAVNVDSSSNESFSFTTNDLGTIAPQYQLSASSTACTSTFYNGLEVEVTQSGVVYDGAINTLNATSSSDGLWSVAVTAGSAMFSNGQTCEINLTLRAWQTEFNEWNLGGFSKEIVMTLVVTAGEDVGPQPTANVVLNEIYPNANNASSSPLNLEWIELYNGTDSSIDVEGWDLSEMSGVNENMISISASNTCAPSFQQGYARPYNGASTIIPAGGLLVIELCENNSMNNNGDTIRLYDATDTQIDIHVYGDTAKGKSHSRIPDGGTWVDPIPSPGVSNMSTITKDDLEAEGWTPEMIEEVLGKPEEILPDESVEGEIPTVSTGSDETDGIDGTEDVDPAKSDDEDEDMDSDTEEDYTKDEDDNEETEDDGAVDTEEVEKVADEDLVNKKDEVEKTEESETEETEVVEKESNIETNEADELEEPEEQKEVESKPEESESQEEKTENPEPKTESPAIVETKSEDNVTTE